MHVRSVFFLTLMTGVTSFAVGRYGLEAVVTQLAVPHGAAVAQDTRPAPPPPVPPARNAPPPAAPASPALPAVDESALRYFASQGDTRRLEAETARLRALYPEWKPPADLGTPVQVRDTQLEQMWTLFAEGKFGELRAAIAARQAAEPAWQVPADLTAQLDEAEAAQRLLNAADAKQWDQVVRIATDHPSLLTCKRVDSLWRVAEAFSGTGRGERARDVYAYILEHCSDPAERLATMQKALAVLGEPAVESFLSREKGTEFAPIRDDLARRRIGRAAEDPKLTAAAEDLARIETLARAATTPDDAVVLGFYALHHGDPAKAADWFRLALDRKGGAKPAEGLVLALGAVNDFAQAEQVGAQWLEAGPPNRKAYLDVATALIAQEPPPRLEQAVVERIVRTIGTDRYAPGAQGLGWYAYNSGQTSAAATWFETALTWDPEQEPAAYGLALSRQRLRDGAGLRAIVAQWGTRSDRIAALLDPRRRRAADLRAASALPLDAAMPLARPDRTAMAGALRGPAGEHDVVRAEQAPLSSEAGPMRRAGGACGRGASGGAALARGWCLLELKRPVEAVAAFEAAIRTGRGQVVEDALSGKVYAQLQRGLTAEAGVAAAGAPISRTRRRELNATLLAERFYAQYEAKNYNRALITLEERRQYAPEDTGLMMMRGWSYFNLGRYADARRVFKALHRASNSSEALGGLAAIDDATRINRY